MTFLNRAHRVAAVCGAAPLLLGTAIFVVWLVARWDWLMIAGAVVLYGGLAIFATGVIALALSCWMGFHTPGIQRPRVWMLTLGCAGLLLANFPVAGGIIWTAITIATRYTVVVHNTSEQRLEGVWVFGGGCDASYGTLLPGATARHSFWIRGKGTLTFRASSGEGTLERTIDEYVTTNSGGHVTVTVHPDRTLSVTRQAPNQLAPLDRARDVLFWFDQSPCESFRRQSWNAG
jgi:hypothetical protein